jgi:hypothetical protein
MDNVHLSRAVHYCPYREVFADDSPRCWPGNCVVLTS